MCDLWKDVENDMGCMFLVSFSAAGDDEFKRT